MKLLALAVFFWCASACVALACSSAVLKKGGKTYLAKNFDWTYREGNLLVNPRAYARTAYYTHGGEPASWTSRYGSITFNQNGMGMPYGGLNEKGLAVEMLWLDLTKYNISDSKPYVNELEWIQFQLDNYATVAEVIANLDSLKVFPIKGRIHYVLADPSGQSAIVEFLGGKAVHFPKDANACQAITNRDVQTSAPYADHAKGIRKRNTAPTYRYHKLEQQIKKIAPEAGPEVSEKLAFDLMADVSIARGGQTTMWTIVYSLHEGKVAYFTDKKKEKKTLRLAEIDFSSTPRYLDLYQDVDDVATALLPLTEADNRPYVTGSLVHLGFDAALAAELSQAQFGREVVGDSQFAQNYFHFQLLFNFEQPNATAFAAVMADSTDFKKQKAVIGGFASGQVPGRAFEMHVYGLRNGTYSLVSFIDANRNKKLDFAKRGGPMETYGLFTDSRLAQKADLTFSGTSKTFDATNAKMEIRWVKPE